MLLAVSAVTATSLLSMHLRTLQGRGRRIGSFGPQSSGLRTVRRQDRRSVAAVARASHPRPGAGGSAVSDAATQTTFEPSSLGILAVLGCAVVVISLLTVGMSSRSWGRRVPDLLALRHHDRGGHRLLHQGRAGRDLRAGRLAGRPNLVAPLRRHRPVWSSRRRPSPEYGRGAVRTSRGRLRGGSRALAGRAGPDQPAPRPATRPTGRSSRPSRLSRAVWKPRSHRVVPSSSCRSSAFPDGPPTAKLGYYDLELPYLASTQLRSSSER